MISWFYLTLHFFVSKSPWSAFLQKKKILEEFINEGNDPQETTYFLSDNDLCLKNVKSIYLGISVLSRNRAKIQTLLITCVTGTPYNIVPTHFFGTLEHTYYRTGCIRTRV